MHFGVCVLSLQTVIEAEWRENNPRWVDTSVWTSCAWKQHHHRAKNWTGLNNFVSYSSATQREWDAVTSHQFPQMMSVSWIFWKLFFKKLIGCSHLDACLRVSLKKNMTAGIMLKKWASLKRLNFKFDLILWTLLSSFKMSSTLNTLIRAWKYLYFMSWGPSD